TLHERADLLWLNAVYQSTQRAMELADVSQSDISFYELHDAFTILSVLSLEAAGFAARGEGWKLAQDNQITLTGGLPISTFGGLKSRGNPVGATGVYQAVEATLQLRGAAEANQVQSAQVALIQSVGGIGSTVVSHILKA